MLGGARVQIGLMEAPENEGFDIPYGCLLVFFGTASGVGCYKNGDLLKSPSFAWLGQKTCPAGHVLFLVAWCGARMSGAWF